MTLSWDASTDTVTVGRDSPQASNVDSGGGQLRTADHSNVNAVHLTTDPDNVMASGRNHGLPVSAAAWHEETVIEVNGMTMTAGVAASIGLLAKDANGYRPFGEGGTGVGVDATNPNTASGENAEGAEEQDSDTPAIERLNDVAEHIMTDIVQKVPASELHVAMDAMIDGELSDSLIGTVASNMGILPEQARAQADHVKAAFEVQAIKAVERAGVPNGPAFFQWLSEAAPEAYKDAVRQHVMHGTTGHYDGFVTEYLIDLDRHDPQAALSTVEAAGLQGEFDSSGRLLIKHDRLGHVSWETFVRGPAR